MTVRLRLAIWYGLALVLALTIVGGIAWFWYSSELGATTAAAVRSLADDSRQAIERGTAPRTMVAEDVGPELFVAVFDRSVRIASSRGTPLDLSQPPLRDGRMQLASGPAVVSVVRADSGMTIVAGASLARLERDLRSLARTLAEVGGLAILVAVVGGWWLSGRALAPVDALTREAAAIGASGLDRRLQQPRRRDELARLARTLNDMLGRVEAAVKRERAFIASASHDLRTPIAALLVELELAQAAPPDPVILKQAVANAHEDATRLARITDELLELARVEASGSPLRLERVAIDALVASAIERVRPEATARGVVIEATAPAHVIAIDGVRVEQALVNLVANAVKHGAAPGRVEVIAQVVTADGGQDQQRPGGISALEIEVSDRGPGVDGDLAGHLFEPFSRGPGSGIGLGLATAAAAARAHGGTIGYRRRAGGGSSFWFRVPAGVSALPAASAEPQRRWRRTVHGLGTGRSSHATKPPAT